MNFNLQVVYSDGATRDVVGKAVDIVAFEQKFDISMASLQNSVKVTHLMFLAWHVEHRVGNTKDDFEQWLETVDMVQAADPKK
jgi:hypothetical protein